MMGQYLVTLVVEDPGIPWLLHGQHGMGRIQTGVLNDHHLELVGRETEITQRQVLGQGVILTVTAAAEKLSHTGPVVFAAIIHLVEPVGHAVGKLIDRLELLFPGALSKRIQ